MHVPVLLQEAVDMLVTDPSGTYIDGTLGRAGHAMEILGRLKTGGRLIGIDRDEEAVSQSSQRMESAREQVRLLHGNFADMKSICEQIGVSEVDGVLLDLGISSPQVDTPQRGFSFSKDGPLDMRMDCSGGRTAADVVNDTPENELARLIFRYGEERDARRIAKAVADARATRRIRGTIELAELVARAKGGRRGPTHPATKTFQALRMAVNNEMESLCAGLEAGLSLLRPGGRMAVISFHSLEDREVKECFRRHSIRRVSLQQGGQQLVFEQPAVRILTKKPLVPSADELKHNPRARSARLRVVQREESK